ncbi:MAG: O-antigen ligase family protein [Clostridia bacterium]
MKENIVKKNFKLTTDIFICILIILQSLKKGGFYTSDIYFFVNSITVIGFVYGLFHLTEYFINKVKKTNKKINISSTIYIFAILVISYFLPILFNTCADLPSSQFEFLRYLSIFIVFVIIKNSNNKNIYLFSLISIGTIQAFIGIDGLGSRILQPILKNFNSGYLSKDLTRLSGTIQYANTAAILISISGLLFFDKLNNYINKVKETSNKTNKFKVCITFTLFTIMNLAIILTSSRMALVMYVIATIIYINKSKANKISMSIFVILSYVISFLASNNILDLALKNPSKVYFVFITYCILAYIISSYIIKYIVLNINLVSKINKIKINKLKLSILVGLIVVIYILVGLNMYKPLIVANNTKENTVSRQIYGIKKDTENSIKINVKENEVDTRYSIVIYTEDSNFKQELLTRFEYYSNISGNFNFVFTPKKNVKRLNVSVICYKGNLSINEFKLNDKIKPLEYSILPSDIVFRFKDFLNGSTSLRDRLHYIKDSYKIWTTSPIIGRGGEAFRYLYKDVQTLNYTSTEAHNSIIQIFVESGIIGGIAVCLLIILVIKNNEYSILKLSFIMFILHSLTDLNFSYLICLIVFSMLIGLMENSKKENI